jgi:hypothetical protein
MAAAAQLSIAAVAQLGIGTDRTRPPLPSRSTNHPAAVALLDVLKLQVRGFLAPQAAAEHHGEQRAVAFAFECARVRFIEQPLLAPLPYGA